MKNLDKIIKRTSNDVLLFVKITPNSNKNQISEVLEYNSKFYLKIKIKEMPLENKANRALVEYLSKIFDLPKSSLFIISGKTLYYKTIKIKNSSIDYVQKNILQYIKEK